MGDKTVAIQCWINRETWEGFVEPTQTLLDFLRDELGLTGTKRGCEWMVCGACTVLVDGRPVYSCNLLVADVEGSEVRTVEGLSDDGELSIVQDAFVPKVGAQCGYCTPGQLMSATALINDHQTLSRTQIRAWMQSNLCRCGSYVGIQEAIELAHAKIHATTDRSAEPDSEGHH